jgi:lysozyme family protein
MAALNFEAAFDEIIGHEGELSMVRSDPGNWTGRRVGVGTLKGTKYGISAASYPWEDIKNLTLARAREIYRRDYWSKVSADDLPAGVDLVVFDLAVNGGVGRAAVHLQKAAMVKADMKIGPVTLYAVDQMDPSVLIDRICNSRLAEMKTFPTWGDFGNGWTRRVNDIRVTSKAWAAKAKPPGQPDDPGPEPATESGEEISWWRRLITNLFKRTSP